MVVSTLVSSQELGEESTTLSTENLDQLNSTKDYTLSIHHEGADKSSLVTPMDGSEPPLSFLTKRVRRAAQQTLAPVDVGANAINTTTPAASLNEANPPTVSPVGESLNASSQESAEDVHYGTIDGPNSDNSTSEANNGEFTCNGRKFGYYADEARNCSYYHLCIPVTLPIFHQRTYYQRLSFICADNTWFDQTHIRCEANPSIPCSESAKYYEQSTHLLLNSTSTESTAFTVPTISGDNRQP